MKSYSEQFQDAARARCGAGRMAPVSKFASQLVAPEHSRLLPAAAVLGGLYLLAKDDIARSVTDRSGNTDWSSHRPAGMLRASRRSSMSHRRSRWIVLVLSPGGWKSTMRFYDAETQRMADEIVIVKRAISHVRRLKRVSASARRGCFRGRRSPTVAGNSCLRRGSSLAGLVSAPAHADQKAGRRVSFRRAGPQGVGASGRACFNQRS
jgi:hypothetical protein